MTSLQMLMRQIKDLTPISAVANQLWAGYSRDDGYI